MPRWRYVSETTTSRWYPTRREAEKNALQRKVARREGVKVVLDQGVVIESDGS